MRTEKDFLGEMKMPDSVLFGIHSMRARDNFSDKTPFPVE
jgi:aspartate ammonia-lyase